MSTMTEPTQRPIRRERTERTRRRLMDASVDLLFESGLGAVTTVQITKRAGIVQSGFYKHFASIDECVIERLEQFEKQIAVQLNDAIRSIHDADPFDEQSWAEMLDGVFGIFLRERRYSWLLLRYRHDPTPIGRALSKTIARVRSELATNLWVLGSRFGVPAERLTHMESLADFMIGATINAVEGLLEGRHKDKDALGQMLARNVVAATVVEISTLLEMDPAEAFRAVVRRRKQRAERRPG
jgi:AcrR family transcriptional regulator